LKVENYFEKPLKIELIKETFKKTFKRDFDESYWYWRFLENPVSNRVYINYIIENKVLVAYYAVSPCLIEIHGHEYLIALSNMTMTHPNFQGMGLFSLLANDMKKTLTKDGFIGIFGFANHNSHYGFRKKLKWNDLCVLNQFQLSKSTMKCGENNKSTIEVFDKRLNEEHLILCDDFFVANSPIKLNRSRKILNWRLIKNPQHQYRAICCKVRSVIEGIFIVKEYEKELDVIEFFYKEYDKSEELIKTFVSFVIEKYSAVNIWSNLYSMEHLALERIGFMEKGFNTYFGFIPLSPFEDEDTIYSIKNWHYRFLDSDIY